MRIRDILLFPVLCLLLSSFGAGPARAEASKLSPRARIALAQLEAGGDPRQMMELTGAAVTESGDLDVFIRGTVTRAELEAIGVAVRTEVPGGIFTAFVPPSAVEALEAMPGVERVTASVMCETTLDAAVPTTMAAVQRTAGPGFVGANGAGVLVGDIDTGVSFIHPDFQDAGGMTRLVRIWDQTDAVGPNPAGYAYGSEWFPADINAGTGVCRERDTNGHGSHVMSIIAGDGSGTGGSIPAFTYAGMAPMADMVAIKSSLQNTQILDALAYFFDVATAEGKNAVMNMSFGSSYGPHDGTSDFETGISALTGPGRIVTVSSGNNGNSGIHAGVNVAAPSTAVTLSVAGSAAGRIAAITGYYEETEAMTVTVSHPTLGSSGPVPLGGINAAYPGVPLGSGTTKAYLYIENGAFLSNTNAREVYMEIRGGSTGSVINGTWTITFTPTAPPGAANGRVDLWRFYVSTSALSAIFVTGREDARLVSEPATALGVITVGAWITKTSWTNCANLVISYGATTPPTLVNYIAPFSSNGPTRDGRMKPDIAAPGQGLGAARNLDTVLGACTTASTWYSYLNDNRMHVINQGTSMSAPMVAGAVALFMQKFGPLSRTDLLTKFAALALVDGNTGAVPNNLWGSGKMRVDVTDPSVTVSAPNGGELLFTTDLESLTWSASDPVWSGVSTVDLDLSRDGGFSWESIAAGIPNSGSHAWTVTGPSTPQAILRVRAHDVADNVGTDVSDAEFTIADHPVPVELALFRAEATDAGVRVTWRFADDAAFVLSAVERADRESGPWARLETPILAVAEGSAIEDASGTAGATYFYRLVASARDGERSTFGPIMATAGRPITEFLLGPAWPNPTRDLARVDFAVPSTSHVALRVFDVRGREVVTLADREFTPGRYQTGWDGNTTSGAPAASGIYFIHLTSPERNLVQRVTLAR